MHDNEFPINVELVRSLVRTKFDPGQEFEVTAVDSEGTDNALYRVGGRLVARFPRIESASLNVRREWEWLGRLAGRFKLSIPEPVHFGEPGATFPWPWILTSWIDGECARADDPGLRGAADDLGAFIVEMHAVAPEGAPRSPRGGNLVDRDEATRRALAKCGRWINVEGALAEWDRALSATVEAVPEVMVHGDLAPGNVIVRDGHVVGVIDFSTITLGDGACDFMVAWNLLDAAARRQLRLVSEVDEATWLRGRGWALSVAALQLPYYATRNRALAANSRRVFAELAADPE